MQTPSLSPSTGVAANPASPAKAADKHAPDGAFSLLLTQEMTQQQTPPAQPPAPSTQPSKAPQSSRDTTAAGNAQRDEAARQTDKNQDASSAKPAEAGGKTEAADTAETRAEDKAADATENTEAAAKADNSAPADMLAFMANLQQMQARPATPAAKGQSAADPALPAARARATAAGIAPRLAVADAAPDPAAAKTAANTVPDKARPEPAFAARLTEAANNAKAPETVLPQAFTQEARAETRSALTESLPKLAESVTTAMPLPPAQFPGIHALQTAAGQVPDKLTPPVGSPAWDQALGQKVVWMASGEQQSATLTLNPPDLGPLQVVLNVSNSQADATFIAPQAEVRQALEAALPKLRDMLGDAGIQLGQASVNSGTPNQQGGAEQRHAPGRDVRAQQSGANEAAPAVSRIAPAAGGLGLVDTFA